jgi:hypothetical protein
MACNLPERLQEQHREILRGDGVLDRQRMPVPQQLMKPAGG